MVIGTGREEEEEGEKVDLKICSASVRDKSTDHNTKEDFQKFVEIFHYKYYVTVFFQLSTLKGP